MTNFIALDNNFNVMYVASSMPADSAVAIAVNVEQINNLLSVSQMVQIAKSLNSELKVNIKQNRNFIMEQIEAELAKCEVVEVAAKTTVIVQGQKTSKAICYEIFATIDMDNKMNVRKVIDAICAEHDIPKRVVQSYASNFRKQNA